MNSGAWRSMRSVGVAVGLLSLGCATANSHWYVEDTHDYIAHTDTIRNGHELKLVVDGGKLSATLRPQCRTAEFGETVSHEAYSDNSKGHLVQGILALAGLGAGAGLMVSALNYHPDPGDNSGDGGEVATIFSGALLITGGIVIGAIRDPIKILDHRVEREPIARWSGPLQFCGPPSPASKQELKLALQYAKADKAVELAAVTGADGTLNAAQLLDSADSTASFCGKGTVAIALARQTAEPSTDSPSTPFTGSRLRGAKLLSLEPTTATSSITDLLQRTPALGALAMKCCKRSVFDQAEQGCANKCGLAGDVTRCVFALRACKLKADASEEPELGAKVCQTGFEGCLTERGTTLSNFDHCENLCRDREVMARCQ